VNTLKKTRAHVLLLAVALSVGAATLAPTARADAPCWRTIIHEWVAGGVHVDHPVRCYRQAIANAPADLKIYSNLTDDLQRLIHSRVLGHRRAERGLSGVSGAPVAGDSRPIPSVRVLGIAILSASATTLVVLLGLGARRRARA
jgi:hypothetical protein